MAYDTNDHSTRAPGADYDEAPRSSLLGALIGRRPADTFAIATIAVLGIGVVINAVAFQKTPHPTPMFAPGKASTSLLTPPSTATSASTLTRADTMATATIVQPSAPPTMESLTAGSNEVPAKEEGFPPALDRNLVTNVQSELLKRGFYSGQADGVSGPRTEAAVKQYQSAARLSPTGEITDDLLMGLRKSNLRKSVVAVAPPTPQRVAQAMPQAKPKKLQETLGQPKQVASLSVQPVRNPNHGDITASIDRSTQRTAAKMVGQPLQLDRSADHAKPRSAAPLMASAEPARPAVNKTMLSAERALARAGYGPVKVDGVYDVQTRNAILRFERDNNLPQTGQLSGAVIRALASKTGEPFN